MTHEVVQPQGWAQYLIPIAVIAVVFALRARRMTRLRPLKLEQLWIVPAVYLVIIGVVFAFTPPRAVGWLVALGGVLIGAAIGWQRGRMMTIHVDPETHALNQKASPLAMAILFAIVLLKQAAQGQARSAHLDIALLTDGALGLGLGMLAMTRAEMYLRAKRLLAAARASR